MELSNNLISQFVKATKDSDKKNSESTVYGTAKVDGDKVYVKLDGSDLLTPVSNLTNVKDGERVTVMIKDHTATVTGNITSPSARTGDVEDMGDQVLLQVDELYADKAFVGVLEADIANIEKLVADKATIGQLEVERAEIEELIADKATIGQLEAEIAMIDQIYATKAEIESLDVKYANVDFANISEAAIEKIYAEVGIIDDMTISDGRVTGTLVGVKIIGDVIEAGTIKADSLIVEGEDGLFYKLNVNGATGEIGAEQTEYNSISGSIITAQSITANKIAVDDLVAFGATIGGFKITDDAIYSGVKESASNTTRGIYLDDSGQIAIGDANSFIKYYTDDKETYKLEISADSIRFSATQKTVEETIDEITDEINDVEIGGKNLIRNSTNLIFENYFFTSTRDDRAVLDQAVLGLMILDKEA